MKTDTTSVRRFFVWSRDYYESKSQMFPREDQKHGEFDAENEAELVTKLRKAGLDPEECRWEQLETCWNCGEERVCKETDLGPVCSHECAEQLFAFPANAVALARAGAENSTEKN